MRNHFFITGTDAGVGKTTLAALLCAVPLLYLLKVVLYAQP